MCSERLLIFAFVLSCSGAAHAAAADTVSLKLTPDRCVALQQGRLCYATIQIQWQSNQAQDLCLYAGSEKLQCWQASTSGQWRYEFVARDNQPLQLISTDGVRAEAVVKVNWVQKNPKVKRHWRLF